MIPAVYILSILILFLAMNEVEKKVSLEKSNIDDNDVV